MRRHFGLLLFLIAMGCSLMTAEAQLPHVRLSYPGATAAQSPTWMAKELGLFDRHGIRAELIFVAGPPALAAVLAGETNYALMGGAVPVRARLGGADIVILASFLNRITISILGRPEIRQPADLKGKRVGIDRLGGIPDVATRIFLKRWGLVPFKDVAIIQLGGMPETVAALRGNSVQAAAIIQPLATQAKQLGLVELLDLAQADVEFSAAGVNSTSRFVKTHEEVTRRVIRAIVEGIWVFKANRETALRVLGKYTRVTDPKALEENYQLYRRFFQLTPRTSESAVGRVLEFIAEDNPKARTANPREFYTTRFIDDLEREGFIQELAARYPDALR